ncbi:xanthine dehydrogenase family protein subunit M [Desulfobacterales bacterium HSG2]|nr:xanthine dehydrogenase family protein subunit M [Desulfobacterales bacterium HSG2]
MLLPKFDFYEPTTIEEACQIMAEFRTKAKLIAGGTDLMVNMKHRLISPEHLISISRLDELKKLDSSNGVVKIGACFTVADLADSEVIGKKLSALRAGARALGSPLIRNLATIGGNLGSARPAADLPPSLMAYNAKVVLKKSSGERTVSLNNFFRGPGLTEIQPDEILTEIQVETPPPYTGAGYINLGVRMAQDCNLVNAASLIASDGPGGVIKSARIVMGCVGPTHLRASSAEKLLIGEKPSEELFAKAGEAAMKDCSPIDDFRGSAEYKKAMVGVLTKRTLGIAYDEILN